MQKSLYNISKMDCPSEENLIRLKLQDLEGIKQLDFNISERTLVVFHNIDNSQITAVLKELNLGSEHMDTTEAENYVEEDKFKQKRLLIAVLLINFSFFIIEMTTGLLSKSMGLVADSLDMLADSFVYGISLLAVGGTVSRKKSIAKVAGYFQIILAVLGFIEILRRYFGMEQMPDFRTMIFVSILALIANGVCLFLLQKSKSSEAHMKASMIFTSNDIIINLGVIVAGTLVFLTESRIPDLVIGLIVFTVVTRGALRILKLSR